ncbi:50S ribosomal protein L28 [Candidatus Margulisiibacteriota bacterium]
MSYQCEICGKKPVTGNKRSHSNIKTRIRWIPNLQTMKIIVDGRVMRAKVCTSCLRSGLAKKAPIRKHILKTK